MTEIKQINSSVSIAMRKASGNGTLGRTTAAMLIDPVQRKIILNSN